MSLDQAVDMLKLVHRIEELETDLRTCLAQLEENTATMDAAHARIEALEAALREIFSASIGKSAEITQIARAALDPASPSGFAGHGKDAGK